MFYFSYQGPIGFQGQAGLLGNEGVQVGSYSLNRLNGLILFFGGSLLLV